MATDTLDKPKASENTSILDGFLSGKARRNLAETLKAYAFLAPAMTLLFTFGIFPIFYAMYVSLFRWRIRQGDYDGMDNYVESMGDVAYVVFGGIALALIGIAISTVITAGKRAREKNVPLQYPLLALLPAAVIAAGLALIILRAITLFAQSDELILGNASLGFLLLIVGCLSAYGVHQFQHKQVADTPYTILPNFITPALVIILTGGAAYFLISFTLEQLQLSERYPIALVRIRFLVTGLVVLVAGYFVWRWSMRQTSNVKLVGGLIGATIMIGMGVQLASWWPQIIEDSDPDFYLSLVVTIFYALFTVPVQLAISMLLAILLYQNIKAKGLFRVIFFVPYIAPAVATAGVFEAIFSIRATSLANWPFTNGGQNPAAALEWLQEASPAIAELGVALGLDAAAAIDWGPSLALFVVILFNIWVFVGYDTVIFLAGLGNIPNTLYEAARIDGAGRWALFRYITLPLLSPTTYFLSVISIIGTFKAFNHIWILRTSGAQGTTDTASIYFFQTFFRGQRFGYATAMAVVLFIIILVLTIVQNRIAARRVFYG